MLSLNAKALAVASDYYDDNTLTLTDGASKIYSIRLQNSDSDDYRVKVDYDKQFMRAIDFKEEYVLPPKSSTRIEFNVTAPRYDKKNNLFTLSYTVHQLTAPAEGGIPFLTKINKNIKLKVIKDPNKFYIDYFSLGYVAALLLLAFAALKKVAKKQKPAFKNRQKKIKIEK
ncbi:hypothetical protein HYV80_05685 [Candidatus Woesearchaeota archaeon]|nr:hypothetical protein [Candidatus Woesearchaeota archaeon]